MPAVAGPPSCGRRATEDLQPEISSRVKPVDGAQDQLRERGEISSELAGHLHEGPSASLLLSSAALRVIGRRWCRELAAAGVLSAGEQPDTWTLSKGANR